MAKRGRPPRALKSAYWVALFDMEKRILTFALTEHKSVALAAKALGVTDNFIYYRCRILDIDVTKPLEKASRNKATKQPENRGWVDQGWGQYFREDENDDE